MFIIKTFAMALCQSNRIDYTASDKEEGKERHVRVGLNFCQLRR